MIDRVIALLSRGDAPDNKYPDRRGEYWALCPFHHDTRSGSFSASERGFRCFACGASGSLAKLEEKMLGCGKDDAYYSIKTPARQERATCAMGSLDLDEYSRAKRLPASFLARVGVRNGTLWQNSILEMLYLGIRREFLRLRYRLSMTGPRHERFRWARGSGVYPYGLWMLPRRPKAVLLVEGESDAHTLWYYGIPAIGVPGAASWRPEWERYFRGLRVYAWKEPDAAGSEFIDRIAALNPVVIQSRWKDVSECHVATGTLAPEVAGAFPLQHRTIGSPRR